MPPFFIGHGLGCARCAVGSGRAVGGTCSVIFIACTEISRSEGVSENVDILSVKKWALDNGNSLTHK